MNSTMMNMLIKQFAPDIDPEKFVNDFKNFGTMIAEMKQKIDLTCAVVQRIEQRLSDESDTSTLIRLPSVNGENNGENNDDSQHKF